MLLLLGAGVCCAVSFNDSKAQGSGWLVINFGWAFAVFCGVMVAQPSGAHLNPAVTLGLWIKQFASGAAAEETYSFAQVAIYIIAQFVGAFIGSLLCWLAYKKQFDEDQPAGSKLGVFSTGPTIRSYGWNLVTEMIGTFVLVFVIIMFSTVGKGGQAGVIGPLSGLGVAFLILVLGTSLGGPTGYAINPARDLGPRIFHAVWPIPNKGDSDWSYAWVPVVGPILGGIVAGLAGAGLVAAYLPVLG
jgi:glycerol uptake facilitator protein